MRNALRKAIKKRKNIYKGAIFKVEGNLEMPKELYVTWWLL